MIVELVISSIVCQREAIFGHCMAPLRRWCNISYVTTWQVGEVERRLCVPAYLDLWSALFWLVGVDCSESCKVYRYTYVLFEIEVKNPPHVENYAQAIYGRAAGNENALHPDATLPRTLIVHPPTPFPTVSYYPRMLRSSRLQSSRLLHALVSGQTASKYVPAGRRAASG